MGQLLDRVKYSPVKPRGKDLVVDKHSDENGTFYRVDLPFIEYMEDLVYPYEFNNEAIWARQLETPGRQILHEQVDNYNATQTNGSRVPPAEHWAFVARAGAIINSEENEAYFIAHFNPGDFIPTADENLNTENDTGLSLSNFFRRSQKRKPFTALFTKDKKIAALCIQQSPSASAPKDVWVRDPENESDAFVLQNGQLISPQFEEEEWIHMDQSEKIRELNERIYTTDCSGKEYDLLHNNCQHFAMQLLSHQQSIIRSTLSWPEIIHNLFGYYFSVVVNGQQ